MTNTAPHPTSTGALAARRASALGAGAPLFYDQPVHLVRGDGIYLWDAEGRRYIDMYNNVACVGHGNPDVVNAMARQQATLNVHSRYLHEGIVEFAERLLALHSAPLENVIFTCSGTEANDVALRMARIATGKAGIVCTNATYHGNSEAVGKLSSIYDCKSPWPEVRAIPFPELYRPLEPGLGEAELTEAYLDRLRQAIKALEADGTGFAALIVCSIFANEGLPDIPRDFMARATEIVRAAGGLVIDDEVQSGYCRTGRWWGYQTTGFEPDIVVTGKPMGNGLPLAATAASRMLVEEFRTKTKYFNTFASSPLQAAVGMAVLDALERDGLPERAGEVGAIIEHGLRDQMRRCPAIGDVRRRGLFLVVELVHDRDSKAPDAARAADLVRRLKDRGFLTSTDGRFSNLVKIRPPLVIGDEHAAQFVDAFGDAIASIDG
jgi:4-aminobutyrate aminotransferase-like enzyme